MEIKKVVTMEEARRIFNERAYLGRRGWEIDCGALRYHKTTSRGTENLAYSLDEALLIGNWLTGYYPGGLANQSKMLGIELALKVLNCFCDAHSGKNTLPFDEFRAKLEHRCHLCDVQLIEQLTDLSKQFIMDQETIKQLQDDKAKLEYLISEQPSTPTLLPAWAQRLWEACIHLSDKADFKYLWQHMERLEDKYRDLHEAAKEVVANLDSARLPSTSWNKALLEKALEKKEWEKNGNNQPQVQAADGGPNSDASGVLQVEDQTGEA